VVQETYLKALRALPGFEGRSNITTCCIDCDERTLMMLRKRKPEAFFLKTWKRKMRRKYSEPYKLWTGVVSRK
jgi:hypothetical protein